MKFFTIIAVVLVLPVFVSSTSFAGAYIKNKNELFIIFENTVTSNKIMPFDSFDIVRDFKSSENKIYFEYGLGNRLAINGYIKSFNLKMNFDTKLSNKNDTSYFYSLGIQYNLLSIINNYLTLNFLFYDKIKFDNVLFTTSNNDIFTAFEYGLSYSYFFNNFIGLYNNNFISFDIRYKYFKESFKNNFNASLSLGRKINTTSMIILEYSYSRDVIKNKNFPIDKYFYDGNQVLTRKFRTDKILNSLSSTYQTIRLSSITNFTENLSFKIGLENSFYKNNKKSYAISVGFWINFL